MTESVNRRILTIARPIILMGLETGALGSLPQFSYAIDKWPQEKLKTMLMQNSGVTNKEYYGMLWYFLEWSIESSGPRT